MSRAVNPERFFMKNLIALIAVAGLSTMVLAKPATPAPATPVKPAAPAVPATPAAPKADAMAKMDIVGTAIANKDFSTLVAALKAAGLVEALQGKGPFTVFAPTNAAFEKLGKEKVADLLKPENKTALGDILKFHVIAASVKAADVVKMKESSKTLQGTAFMIEVKDKTVKIGNKNGMATVTATDIECTNGVIHVIDSVITPIAAETKKDAGHTAPKADAPKAPAPK